MRNIKYLYLIITVSLLTAVALYCFSILFISPSFTNLIIKATEAEAIKVGRHLSEQFSDQVAFDTHLSALSIIGEGLNESNETLLQTIALLHNNMIQISGITTTSFRISLLVPSEDIEKSVQLCHEKWITEE